MGDCPAPHEEGQRDGTGQVGPMSAAYQGRGGDHDEDGFGTTPRLP
jgi:hypothetical protein